MGSNSFNRSKPDEFWAKIRKDDVNRSFRRQRQSQFQNGDRISNKDVSSFYITKFSDLVLSSDLWRVCNRIGKVVDVFISNIKSRLGNRFGFIRFMGVIDMKA